MRDWLTRSVRSGHSPDHMPALFRWIRFAAILLAWAPAVVHAGALRECTQGCRIVQGGCVEDVQAAYQSARAECETSGGGRDCTRGAKLARKTADRACRKYTKKTCKP